MSWKRLDSEDIINEVVESSKSSPIIVFKHSTRCPTSAMAFDRINRSWNEEEMEKSERYYLDVIADRHISNQVASHFGVHHESPQVLVIWEGQSVYNNSHLGISYQEIKSLIEELTPAG